VCHDAVPMNSPLGTLLGFHQAFWAFDPWYRRAWLIWPQGLSLIAIMLMLPDAGSSPPTAAQWVKPVPVQAHPDHPLCMNAFGDARLRGEACDRLIASGRLTGIELGAAYMGRAFMKQRANQVDLAIADYSEALKHNPRNFAAYFSRGLMYLNNNDLANAEQDLDKAIEKSPGNTNAAALAYKADVRRRQGKLSEAQADINRALAIQSDLRVAQMIRDSIQADIRRSREAGVKPPVQVSPAPGNDPTAALRTRARANLQKGDYDTAIVEFTELIRNGSRDPADYDGRGTAYGSKQQFDLAMADFSQAVGLSGHTWHPHSKRAEIHMRRGDLDQALGDLNAAIRDHAANEVRVFLQRGRVHLRKEAYRPALDDFDKVVELAPNFAEGYLLRGQASAADVRALMEHCRRQSNQSGGRQSVDGGPCTRPVNFNGALADLRTAISKKSDLAEGHNEIGRIMYNLNRLEEAAQAYSSAIQAMPTESSYHYNRGLANMKLNKRELALTDFNEAIRLDLRNKRAWFYRGQLYENAGQRRQAIDDYRKALDVDGQFAPALEGLKRLGIRQ
jgi:tetratricopeptide (TPR) repeat protein